ncbi:hypothetical protein [Paraburkholderia youngii]|uniref:hypothetical protein n=1 Tax=Paraburkholderia youngii TaxID=2782701 RepID=UPI003D22F797
MNLNAQAAVPVARSAGYVSAELLNSVISVNASQKQHTPAGRLLGRMYRGSFIDSTVSRDEFSGYDHNGGEHTFRLHMKPADIAAFLELVEETFASHDGMPGFVASVTARAVEKYPRLAEFFGAKGKVH